MREVPIHTHDYCLVHEIAHRHHTKHHHHLDRPHDHQGLILLLSRYSAPLVGALTGVRMAAKSLEPSLMPRSAIDQGLIMAGSFVTGFVAGSTSARVLGLLPPFGGSAALRLAGVVATGARTAGFVRDIGQSSSSPMDPAAAWTETGTDVLSGVAVAGMASNSRPALGTISAIAVTASTVADVQAALEFRDDQPDAKYLATAAGTALGTVAAVGGLISLIRVSGYLARRTTRTTGLTGVLLYTGGAVAAVGLLGVGARAALGRATGAIAKGNQAYELAYQDAPEGANVAGGDYSLIPYDTLGLQGRRLVSVATSPAVIESVMGEPARKDPVRVFVGVDSADSIEERVELAIQELRRTGGFERSRIIAASPAGTGYVNYITVEAAELMARGDVATVAIQYGSLPSMLSMNKIATASTLYSALVARLRSEIDQLDRTIQLVAYGESLGAQTGQNGIEKIWGGVDLPVDGALWVGTPSGTVLFEKLTVEGSIPVFDRPEQLTEYIDSGGPLPPATFLNHDNDPVASFAPSTFYEMPDWLRKPDRGRGVNPYQRWLPGVAFWQGLIDTKNAATVVPGEFKSTGHDYRADLGSFIRLAYGFDDVTAEQMARIEEKLRASEVERAENIERGRVQTA